MAGPGESGWEVGRRRVLRDAGGSSWRNGTVMEQDGAVVGLPVRLPAAGRARADRRRAAGDVRAAAGAREPGAGTWYVNILAVAPAQRGRGHGASLLRLADRLRRGRAMSVIVADANQGARRLYERCGYAAGRRGRWSRRAGRTRRSIGCCWSRVPPGRPVEPAAPARAMGGAARGVAGGGVAAGAGRVPGGIPAGADADRRGAGPAAGRRYGYRGRASSPRRR